MLKTFLILGGGAPPVPTSPQATAAIGLAPPGTVPVAVFPPYEIPRTLSAISVIFAENPASVPITRRLFLSERISILATKGKKGDFKWALLFSPILAQMQQPQ